MYFATLKGSRIIHENEWPINFLSIREYSDIFVKSLIYLIEKCKLKLYGFVILSDQIHLIVSSPDDDIHEKIEILKKTSAREILRFIGKKLNAVDDDKSRKYIELRNIFNRFLNTDESVFWGGNEKLLPLRTFHNPADFQPITSDQLVQHLTDKSRNYLQLGANAFTRLMMEAM
jgi:REP element-mobilizing transposase RayT